MIHVPFDPKEERLLTRMAARKGLSVPQLVRRMIRCDLLEQPHEAYA